MIVSLSIFALIANVLSHPQLYPINRNETCYKQGPPKVFSWHVHVLFWGTNEEHSAGAAALKSKFEENFKDKIHGNCKSTFDQINMCMFPTYLEANDPFLVGNWAAFFMPEDFAEVATWIAQNRGVYDAVLHPNTGCMMEDHSWWTIWAGQPWELDLSAFNEDGGDSPWEPAKMKTKKQIFNSKKSSDLVKNFLNEHDQEHLEMLQ